MGPAQYRVWSPADGEEEGGAESFGEDSAADAAESFAAAYDFDGVNEVSVLVRCPDGSLAGFLVEREWSPSYSASPRDPATLLPKKS